MGNVRRVPISLEPPEDAEAPEWPVVTDEVIEIDAEQDQYVETSIDLSDAFDQVDSQIVVRPGRITGARVAHPVGPLKG